MKLKILNVYLFRTSLFKIKKLFSVMSIQNLFSCCCSCARTQAEIQVWWQVDLGQTLQIVLVRIYNRGDNLGQFTYIFQQIS